MPNDACDKERFIFEKYVGYTGNGNNDCVIRGDERRVGQRIVSKIRIVPGHYPDIVRTIGKSDPCHWTNFGCARGNRLYLVTHSSESTANRDHHCLPSFGEECSEERRPADSADSENDLLSQLLSPYSFKNISIQTALLK